METFMPLKDFVDNPDFENQRRKSLAQLDFGAIDPPMVKIIRGLSNLPFCFTLQSCCGHFVYAGQNDPQNTVPLPDSLNIPAVEYRIAYIALCIENNRSGRELFESLKRIPEIDPGYVQFGCADWFWSQYSNSFALQVEPERFKHKDKTMVDYTEALRIEKVKNRFIEALADLVRTQHD